MTRTTEYVNAMLLFKNAVINRKMQPERCNKKVCDFNNAFYISLGDKTGHGAGRQSG
jgi:hypothetical protein